MGDYLHELMVHVCDVDLSQMLFWMALGAIMAMPLRHER